MRRNEESVTDRNDNVRAILRMKKCTYTQQSPRKYDMVDKKGIASDQLAVPICTQRPIHY